MKILISACLLGLPCRYDGASKPQLWVEELARRHELIPMCPEQMGGLPTPRNPSERRGDRVVMRTGEDVTEQYRRGAACALRLYQLLGCKAAVLKERSPSCGCGAVYDGTFTGTLTAGDGVTAALLLGTNWTEQQLLDYYGDTEYPPFKKDQTVTLAARPLDEASLEALSEAGQREAGQEYWFVYLYSAPQG